MVYNTLPNLKFLLPLNLTFLNIYPNTLHDRDSYLLSQKYLKTLCINNLTIQDFSYIASLTSLNRLDSGPYTASDIEPLFPLVNLTNLDLSYNETLKRVEGIEVFSNLTNFSVSNTTISDLSPLKALSNLSYLSIKNSNVEDVSYLMNKFLNININQ